MQARKIKYWLAITTTLITLEAITLPAIAAEPMCVNQNVPMAIHTNQSGCINIGKTKGNITITCTASSVQQTAHVLISSTNGFIGLAGGAHPIPDKPIAINVNQQSIVLSGKGTQNNSQIHFIYDPGPDNQTGFAYTLTCDWGK